MDCSLSVLLPVHNHQSVLAARVQAILEVIPELTRHFELLIIDDGSTDATIEVADELSSLYPQVRAVRHSIPLGRLAALRTGLKRTNGQFVLLYDQGGGLSLREIESRWRSITGTASAVVPCRPHTKPMPPPPLWTESPPAEGYQLIDRKTMRFILDQADAAVGIRPGSPAAGRPRRPNYMARLRAFALGE